MTKTIHGKVRGRTIELDEDPGIADGQAVEVIVRAREKISWAILLNPRKRSALGFNISPC